MNKTLLDILCCPVTHSRLHAMPAAALAALNRAIDAGGAKRLDGRNLSTPWQAALVTEDGSRAYPVRDEIPILLEHEAVNLIALDIPAS